jgi:hypothetical protein
LERLLGKLAMWSHQNGSIHEFLPVATSKLLPTANTCRECWRARTSPWTPTTLTTAMPPTEMTRNASRGQRLAIRLASRGPGRGDEILTSTAHLFYARHAGLRLADGLKERLLGASGPVHASMSPYCTARRGRTPTKDRTATFTQLSHAGDYRNAKAW